MAHMLRLAVINRYGPAAWNCTDFPPADGETPVGGVFLKQRCEKLTAERYLSVEAHFSAQARTKRHRSQDRGIHVRPVRELDRFEVYDPVFRKR